jgi:hypothetical protein
MGVGSRTVQRSTKHGSSVEQHEKGAAGVSREWKRQRKHIDRHQLDLGLDEIDWPYLTHVLNFLEFNTSVHIPLGLGLEKKGVRPYWVPRSWKIS